MALLNEKRPGLSHRPADGGSLHRVRERLERVLFQTWRLDDGEQRDGVSLSWPGGTGPGSPFSAPDGDQQRSCLVRVVVGSDAAR